MQTTQLTATPHTAAMGGVARCRGRDATATLSVIRSETAAVTTTSSASTRSQQQQQQQQSSTLVRGDAALVRAGHWSELPHPPSVTVTQDVSV